MDQNILITQRLLLSAQLIEKVGDRVFAPFGLTIKTHQILRLIEEGVDTTSAIATCMNLTKAGVTQKTKVLEQKGYLARAANGQDLRVWNFHLTPKGEQALAGVAKPYARASELLLSDFSAGEKDQLMEGLMRVSTHLADIKEAELKDFIFQLETDHGTGE